MELRGHIRNGVVFLDGNPNLPDGLVVRVVVDLPKPEPVRKRVVEFPLVSTGEPGSIPLTNDRIQEILEQEELVALKRSGHVPS
jgi:hypothetical protein